MASASLVLWLRVSRSARCQGSRASTTGRLLSWRAVRGTSGSWPRISASTALERSDPLRFGGDRRRA
jgi:hypothetical protein